jgi:predicted dehydrogenase
MINVAVMATGYIGPVHIEALRRISGITVKGITDANTELAQKTAQKHNIESEESARIGLSTTTMTPLRTHVAPL